MTTAASLTSAIPTTVQFQPGPSQPFAPHTATTTVSISHRRFRTVGAVGATELSSSSSAVSTSEFNSYSAEELEALEKVGRRIKVILPLKVYHVPKVSEIDLEGLEGVVKQYVGIWKGKRISANLPFKVEFLLEEGVEERPGPVKFVAHLRDDEVDFISDDRGRKL